MNYYQKKIDELSSEIYHEIVDAMKSNGTTEIDFTEAELDELYFVGEYGDDLAEYQITKVYLTENDALYVKAHNKWNANEATFSVKWDYGFHDLRVLNGILLSVIEVLTELPPKKKNIVVLGDHVEICGNKVVNVEIK
jgi:hypothetical protein